MKQIDLHGLYHDEALLKVENFLLLESVKEPNGFFECTIITGNSPQLQEKIIKNVLDKHNFSWYMSGYNQGAIIVSETFL